MELNITFDSIDDNFLLLPQSLKEAVNSNNVGRGTTTITVCQLTFLEDLESGKSFLVL